MMRLSDFEYPLDPASIAQHPLTQRDGSRLLVFFREPGKIEHRSFHDLADYMKAGDVLILNDTRVLAARLIARKEKTSGRVELLLTKPVQGNTWEALASGRLKPGQTLIFEDGSFARVVGPGASGVFLLDFQVNTDFRQWLDQTGRTPLPPYIKRMQKQNNDRESEDRRAYQTVYANTPGSVAAPTAGLHFTQNLLERIRAVGVQICFLTLHIGPGTFRPVRVSRVEEHIMDREYFCIPPETVTAIQQARNSGGRVIAVGTTAVRALESAAWGNGGLHPKEGWTGLFITPGYRFRVIDALITNFHLPCSTLLMLVSAFAGREPVLAAYEEALRGGYRFYSFGDAMLIL